MRHSGFSLQWLLVAEHRLVIVEHGLSCSKASEIFPDQGLNPCLLPWQVDSLPLSHQGSPEPGFEPGLSASIVGAPDHQLSCWEQQPRVLETLSRSLPPAEGPNRIYQYCATVRFLLLNFVSLPDQILHFLSDPACLFIPQCDHLTILAQGNLSLVVFCSY